MVRVKIIKPHKRYKTGETLYLTNNEAFDLIDSGFAIISKDVVSSDMTIKKVKKK